MKATTNTEVIFQDRPWISVKDQPLCLKTSKGWVCTENGEKEFLAAVPLEDGTWWIRHCVVEDEIGLCVVGDVENEPAGYELEDVTHYQFIPEPPQS